MTNMDKLYEAVEARGPVCVGLDTDFSYLPADFVDSTLSKGENIVRFNKKLIDATKAVAGCYKVQIAYYESLGLEGLKAYADTLKAVREAGVPVIADIKRGDIAKTAEMYAMGHFTGDFEADFVTLAPYMGLDSISPYLPYAEKQGKGMFVLCRTSNGGAKDFEYEKLADGRHEIVHVDKMCNECGNCTQFCPYASEPCHDKFTLFQTAKDMDESENKGVLFLGGDAIRVRLDTDRTLDLSQPNDLPRDIETLILTLRSKYSYLYTE